GLAGAIRDRRSGTCAPLFTTPMDMVGTRCELGIGTLYQAKVPIFDVFNTDFYYQIGDAAARRGVFDRIFAEQGIVPHVRIAGGGDRTVTFARANAELSAVWITAKTARHAGFSGSIQWTDADPKLIYEVTDVLSGQRQEL